MKVFQKHMLDKARKLRQLDGDTVMYSNILVPVLLEEGGDTETSYFLARALADEDAKFTIMHVLEELPGFVIPRLPNDLLSTISNDAEKSLIQAAKALPGAITLLVSGHAGRSIVDYANEHNIDCIIIASHRPGMEDFFLGSTASRVVRHAKCSVHVIR